jgi:regulatory protein
LVTGVLDDLERAGVVDDLRFCRLYLGEQARSRPRSVRLMRHDLRREGIAPEVIDQACVEMAEELDESALAAAAARRKLRFAGHDPERLRRLLRTRGFDRDAIEEALKSVGSMSVESRSEEDLSEEDPSEESLSEENTAGE